jgi:hypothetical protein
MKNNFKFREKIFFFCFIRKKDKKLKINKNFFFLGINNLF